MNHGGNGTIVNIWTFLNLFAENCEDEEDKEDLESLASR